VFSTAVTTVTTDVPHRELLRVTPVVAFLPTYCSAVERSGDGNIADRVGFCICKTTQVSHSFAGNRKTRDVRIAASSKSFKEFVLGNRKSWGICE